VFATDQKLCDCNTWLGWGGTSANARFGLVFIELGLAIIGLRSRVYVDLSHHNRSPLRHDHQSRIAERATAIDPISFPAGCDRFC
jgi:hypothetical protein